MSSTVDMAIVGAGPYGLSVAAHLRGAGPSVRQFGLPMNLWREHMPRGMFLKSQGFASNLSEELDRRDEPPGRRAGARCPPAPEADAEADPVRFPEPLHLPQPQEDGRPDCDRAAA